MYSDVAEDEYLQDVLSASIRKTVVSKEGSIFFWIDKHILEQNSITIECMCVVLSAIVCEVMCRKDDTHLNVLENVSNYIVSFSSCLEQNSELKEAQCGYEIPEDYVGVCAYFRNMRDLMKFCRASNKLMSKNVSFMYSQKGSGIPLLVVYFPFEDYQFSSLLIEYSTKLDQVIPQWDVVLDDGAAIERLSLL